MHNPQYVTTNCGKQTVVLWNPVICTQQNVHLHTHTNNFKIIVYKQTDYLFIITWYLPANHSVPSQCPSECLSLWSQWHVPMHHVSLSCLPCVHFHCYSEQIGLPMLLNLPYLKRVAGNLVNPLLLQTVSPGLFAETLDGNL